MMSRCYSSVSYKLAILDFRKSRRYRTIPLRIYEIPCFITNNITEKMLMKSTRAYQRNSDNENKFTQKLSN